MAKGSVKHSDMVAGPLEHMAKGRANEVDAAVLSAPPSPNGVMRKGEMSPESSILSMALVLVVMAVCCRKRWWWIMATVKLLLRAIVILCKR